jgi:hypothetical protein
LQKKYKKIEKFRNFRPDNIELVVTDRQGLDIICSVDRIRHWWSLSYMFQRPWRINISNRDCYGIDKDSIIDTLNDYDVI